MDFKVVEIQLHLRSAVVALSLDFPSNGSQHSEDHAIAAPIGALRSKHMAVGIGEPGAFEAW